ncbi:Transferase protein [Dioscorea alata]|uniref:Transferase protein n=1 Tax=Dioscorea alata TaxID=55571 RepID=A0ACB7UCP5_DIOAL|nr:Transferase protein [Dioscorea alata]
MSSSPAVVNLISKSMVKAQPPSQLPAGQKCNLTPWDLAMLSYNYIQKGHLFANLPPTLSIDNIIDSLKTSLSATLHHFYPLAGRLATQHELDSDGNVTAMFVFIDCNNEGAEFIHADAHSISVEDVLAPSSDVPSNLIRQFFPFHGAVCHDGHVLPLVAVQLTVLADGIFLACSFNHAIGDGTSYWYFMNTWAEICRSESNQGHRHVPLDRYFMDEAKPPIKLSFSNESEFIVRYSPPPLREKMFHFSSEALTKLKTKTNEEHGTSNISSFQSLSALMWRCIIRAWRLPAEQVTSCRLAIQNRSRLQPPLSPNYFGNSIEGISSAAKAGELLANGIGWAAWAIHEAVVAHTDDVIRGNVRKWVEAPVMYSGGMLDGKFCVLMGSSPRFDMYGCEFGWGKGVALRSGSASKFEGKVSSYPGWEGGGSVDLEVCLSTEAMTALEADPEFLNVVSLNIN